MQATGEKTLDESSIAIVPVLVITTPALPASNPPQSRPSFLMGSPPIRPGLPSKHGRRKHLAEWSTPLARMVHHV
jgi:hypothetical protein